MTNATFFTREAFMKGECSFRKYYSQFCTHAVIRNVEHAVSIDRVKSCKSEYLSEIPCSEVWDHMAWCVRSTECHRLWKLANPPLPDLNGRRCQPGMTMSDIVCIVKTAALIAAGVEIK